MTYYTTVYKEVEVEVDMDDFDTEDLESELERRGRHINPNSFLDDRDIERLISLMEANSTEGDNWFTYNKLVNHMRNQ